MVVFSTLRRLRGPSERNERSEFQSLTLMLSSQSPTPAPLQWLALTIVSRARCQEAPSTPNIRKEADRTNRRGSPAVSLGRSRRQQKRTNSRRNQWRAGAQEQPIMHSDGPAHWLLMSRIWTPALIGVHAVLPPRDLVVFCAISRCSRPDQLSSCTSTTAQRDNS